MRDQPARLGRYKVTEKLYKYYIFKQPEALLWGNGLKSKRTIGSFAKLLSGFIEGAVGSTAEIEGVQLGCI